MRYLKLVYRFFQISVINSMEYRVDFLFSSILNLFDSVAGLLIVYFLVTKVGNIGEWSSGEVLLIHLVFYLNTIVFAFFLLPGIKQFAEDLNRGNIDGYLVKPAKLQFLASVSRWDWTQIFRLIFSFVSIAILINVYKISLDFGSTLLFLIAFVCGICLNYAFTFIAVTTILFLGRIRPIVFFTTTFWEFGRMPVTIYGRAIGTAFSIVIPLAFAATIPVGIFTGKYPVYFVVVAVALAGGFLVFSNYFLRTGIKRYCGSGN